jgi:hypothetical protein
MFVMERRDQVVCQASREGRGIGNTVIVAGGQ